MECIFSISLKRLSSVLNFFGLIFSWLVTHLIKTLVYLDHGGVLQDCSKGLVYCLFFLSFLFIRFSFPGLKGTRH